MIDDVDSLLSRHVRCAAMSFTPAASLTYLVQKVAVKALNALEESLDDLGITARHYIVLGLASDPDQPSQAVIAGKLGVDATVLGRMLDELEQRDLVVRQRATDDRRRHELVLTKAGRDILATAEARRLDTERQFFGRLSAGERRAFEDALRTLLS